MGSISTLALHNPAYIQNTSLVGVPQLQEELSKHVQKENITSSGWYDWIHTIDETIKYGESSK